MVDILYVLEVQCIQFFSQFMFLQVKFIFLKVEILCTIIKEVSYH